MLNKIEIEGEVRQDAYARYRHHGEFEATLPIYIDNNPDGRSYIYVKARGDVAHNIEDLNPRSGDLVRVSGKLIRESWVRPEDGKPAGAYKIFADQFEIVRSVAESRKMLADRNKRELDRREGQNEPDGNKRPPGPDFSRWK